MKVKKAPPPNVQFAIFINDRSALSNFGRMGAERKKEIADENRRRKRNRLLVELNARAEQANEHLCPVD